MPASARILILAACSAALAAHGQTALPEGNGKAAVQRMCTSCHQLDVITGQRLSQPRWAAKVDEMVALGARGSDSDKQQVVAYLAAHFGNGSSTMTSAGAATGGKPGPTRSCDTVGYGPRIDHQPLREQARPRRDLPTHPACRP